MNTPGTQIDYTEVTKEFPQIDPFHITLELLCFLLQCTSLHSSPVIQHSVQINVDSDTLCK